MGIFQQNFNDKWLELFNYDFYQWNQIPTTYYRLSLKNINDVSSGNIPTYLISLSPTSSQNLFMQDFNPNNREYYKLTINIQWNYRNTYTREIKEGINQWEESGQVIIHKKELTPNYGDLIVNPWDNWRYYMITNVEPHIKEYFYLVDIKRVNYTINVISPSQDLNISGSSVIPPTTDENPFY